MNNTFKLLQTKNRIGKLSGRDPVGNMRIINKLKRLQRRLENG